MSNDVWLSTQKAARLTGESERTVRDKAARREYVSRRERLSRRGRPQLQVALSSLSARAQLNFADYQLASARAQAMLPADPAQPMLFTPPAEVDVKAWADVPPEKREEATRRLNVITPMLEWKAGARLSFTLRDGRAVATMDDLARWLGEQHPHKQDGEPLSRATIWRWYSAFVKEGPSGLVRDQRRDAKRAKYFESHPSAAKFVLAKYAEIGQCSPTGSPNLMLIHSELAIERQRVGSAVRDEAVELGEDLKRGPSPGTIRNYIDWLPPVVRDAARLTREKHDAKYAPVVRTNIAALRPNQYWVSDHRVFDILGYNDIFTDLDPGAAFRVWGTAIEDMRTRVMWIVFAPTPSWKTIASALRMGMRRFGKPEVFYCDNGLDFRKVGGNWVRRPEALDEHGRIRAGLMTENLLQRLDITPQYCLPKHPRSKMIESAFSYVSQRCDVQFGAGYAGHKPSARPDACRAAEKQHQAWLKGNAKTTPFLPVSHIIECLAAWFEERNRYHIFDRKAHGVAGRTAYDVMHELLPSPQPVDVAAIEPLFWEHKQGVTVQRCAVQVNNEIYEGIDERDKYAMYAVNGQQIAVAYDPYDRTRALAVADRRVIAELHPKPRLDRGLPAERSAATDVALSESLRIGRGAHKIMRQTWAAITDGAPTMLDGLRARNCIAAPVAPGPIALPAKGSSSTAPEPVWPEDEAERFLAQIRAKGN